MARPRNPVPTYRLHAKTGRACVSIYKSDGSRTEVLLPGEFGSTESKEEYARILSQLSGNGGKLPLEQVGPSSDLTIAELVEKFMREHVAEYYRHADGSQTGEKRDYVLTVRPLVRLFARKLAREFTPMDLHAYRNAIISATWMTQEEKEKLRKRRGHDGTVCRKSCNQRCGRIKRLFGWGVEMGLIPASVTHGLREVKGLQAGRGKARESKPVEPVPLEHVEACLPHLSEIMADMVNVQLYCGARAGEVVKMRTIDIDQTSIEGAWVYAPSHHKNKWRGHVRKILIGPRCQLVLRRYLRPEAPEKCLFRPGTVRPGGAPKKLRACYSVSEFDKQIARACKRAGVPHWSSHQLRHLAAQLAEREIDLEGARAYLGHKTPTLTAHYASIDMKTAAEVAKRIG